MADGKKETLYHFALTLATKATTYLLLVVFANFFSLLDYGQASFALTCFTISSVLVFSGFSSVFIPFYVKKKDVSSIFYFSGLAAFAMAALALIVSLKYPIAWPFAFAFVFSWLTQTARSLMRAQYRYHIMQWTELLFMLANFALVILWRGLGDFGIVYANVASTFVVMLACVWFERRALLEVASKARIDWSVVKIYLIKSLSVVALLISSDFLGRFDSVVLGFLSTFENVALYSMASALAGVLSAIAISISMFLLTRSAQLGEGKSDSVFKRSLRIAFSLNLLAAIGLISLIHSIIFIFFKQYVGIEIFVTIIASSTLFYSLYTLYVTEMMAHLKPETAFKSIIVAAGFNLILDFVLIPLYGVWGICAATLAAGMLAFTLTRLPFPRSTRAFIYLSPLFLFAAYYLHAFGLVLLAPAVWFLFKAKLFEKSDLVVLQGVAKGILSR